MTESTVVPATATSSSSNSPARLAVGRFFRRKLTNRHFLLGGLLLAVVVASTAFAVSRRGAFGTFGGTSSNGAPEAEGRSRSGNSLTVATVVAERQTQLSQQTQFTGQIKATRQAELAFEFPGRLIDVLVEDGDRVRGGVAVARLDTKLLQAQLRQLASQHESAVARLQELENGPREETIEASKAAVAALRAKSQQADASRQRKSGLVDSRAISREEFDAARYEAEAASARLREAEFHLQELQRGTRQEQIDAQRGTVAQLAAAVDEVRIQLEKSEIVAPFDAVVQRRYLDEGEMVTAGKPVISVHEAEAMEAWIGVSVEMAADLDQRARIKLQIGDRLLDATLKTLLPEVSTTTRTRTAIFQLDLSTLAQRGDIVPGRIVQLNGYRTVDESGFWLPRSSLVVSGYGLWSVYIVENGRVARREVEIIRTENNEVFVDGTLRGGDVVIASGVHRLVVGQSVTPQTAN